MADLGTLNFQVHLQDYTDADADKIRRKLENLSVRLNIDASSSRVSNTDAIKRQIEQAVHSISISSVKVDASAVKQGIESAAQQATPKVSVTLASGNLSNDIQAYLNTKSFSIQVTISTQQAKQSITQALATLTVPVNVSVKASAVLAQLRQQLSKTSVPVSVRAKDVNSFVNDLKTKLGKKAIKIDLNVNKSNFNKNVRAALQGKVFKADLKLNIKTVSVQEAIRQAFAKAGMQYNTTASDVRAARVAEIQQRMAMRAANANRALSGSYRQAASGANKFARASVSLSNGLHTNLRLGGQLGTVLGNFASLFQFKDILQSVIQIGGQLENQRIALSAILQDGGKATTLFNQIQSLAVKSPFGIMDLNQYTKQLSAYGVAYNEIYDTMKRLADISAGVGVDMGRIILAFGQVKAAGFLKGTELRQFTEANIPMVQALADRFTALRGEIVSAADVYDMISKKQITFDDVKAVLDGLTDEGGMFHNMQEVLSESLASKWKNLADAVDVVYGKIADGFVGSGLKGLAEGLTALTKQWEYIAMAIASATVAFSSYKLAVVLGSKMIAQAQGTYGMLLADKRRQAAMLQQEALYRKLTRAELALINTRNTLTNADVKAAVANGTLNKQQALRLITLGKLDKAMLRGVQRTLQISNAEIAAAQNATYLRRAWVTLTNGARGLWVAMKGLFLNPMTWVLTAVMGIAEVFTYFKKKSDEAEQRVEDMLQVANEGYKNLSSTIKQFDESVPDSDFGMATRIEEIKKVLKDNLPNWGEIFAEIYKTDNQGNYVNDLRTRYELFTQTLNNVSSAYKLLANEMKGVSEAANASTDGNLDDSLLVNLKDYTEAVNDYNKAVSKLSSNYAIFEDAIRAAMEADGEYKEKYQNASAYEQIRALKDYQDAYAAFMKYAGNHNWEYATWINEFTSELGDLRKALKNVNKDLDTFILNYKKDLIGRGFDFNNLTEERRMAIILDLQSWINQIDGLDEETKKLFTERVLVKEFNIKLTNEEKDYVEKLTKPKVEYDPSKDEVAKQWKKRTEEIDKAVAAYDKWKALEGNLRAEQRIKGMDEFANLFNGKYGFNLSLEDPTDAYKYVQGQLNKNLSAQNEVYVNLGVKISDAELDDAKEQFKLFVDGLKDEVKQATEQWDLYKQLFEATGDKEFAKTAFANTQVWDDAALAMKEKFEEAMKEYGLDFDADFDIDESSARLLFGDLYDTWKEIKDRIEKNGINLKVNAAKAIEQTQSLEDKIKKAETQRDEELSQYTEGTPDYDAIAKKWEYEITALKGELFELSPAFKKLFVDTTGMATGKIHELWEQARNLVNLINANTTQKVTNANGEVVGRYYTDADGNEQYISEDSFEKISNLVGKLGKKTPAAISAFNRLWDAIRGDGDKDYGFKDIANDVAVLTKEIASSAEALSGMFDALGNEDMADGFALAGDLLGGVASIGAGFASGNPFEIINGVASIITSISSFHDNRLDKKIQKSALEVKKLENAYAALERVISRQLGSVTAEQSEEMLKNLTSQRDELNKQMDYEDDKKKTDKSKIEDYEAQIAELDDQIKHFYEDLAKEQYGVDVKDWAGQIAESLVDAFASGEDAAKVFDQTVGEILDGLIKDIIKLNVIAPAMTGLQDYLFGENGVFTANSEGGTDLTAKEAAGLAKEMEKVKGSISDAEKIWNALNDATGGMLETTEAANDSLAGNIKSITEDTANLLASYLNAMRQDVSVNRKLVEKLVEVDMANMNLIANAQLTQLRLIQANTLRNADAADAILSEFRAVLNGTKKVSVK